MSTHTTNNPLGTSSSIRSISCYDRAQPLWTLNSPLNSDLVAGLAIAVSVLLDSKPVDGNTLPTNGGRFHCGLGGRLPLADLLSNYHIVSSTSLVKVLTRVGSQMAVNQHHTHLNQKYYLILIRRDQSNEILGYHLVSFDHSEFLQGLISVGNWLGISTSSYMFGSCFTISKDGRKVFYTVR